MANLVYVRSDDINNYLNEVHGAIMENYLNGIYNGLGSKEVLKRNAQTLQDFLQKLKAESRKKKDDQSVTFKMVLDEMHKALGSAPRKKAVFGEAYDRSMSIDPFERELNAVFYAVTKKVATRASAKGLSMSNFGTGTQSASVDLEQEVLRKYTSDILTECGEIAEEELAQLSDAYGKIVARSGKPDNQGVEVEIRVDADPYLLQIYEIIKRAKFSDKNYKDTYFNKKEGKSVAGSATLHLGNSNALKAYYGVLTDLGASSDSAVNSFYRAYFHWKKWGNTDSVAKNIFVIRQVYELIGAGMVYKGANGISEKVGNVDYLIYNVPDSTTAVYVKSVPEILEFMFKNVFDDEGGNPFTKAITVAKELFSDLT